MHRFYAPEKDFTKTGITLSEGETRHFRDVLRLKIGHEVNVFDGLGSEYRCRIEAIEKRQSTLTVVRETPPTSPESPFEITLAVAILKGDKFDLVIQKAVELGVVKVIPLQTIRGDVKPKSTEHKMERLRRIALDATKQCGRARLMEIAEPVSFDTFIGDIGPIVLFSERGGEDFSAISRSKTITAVVGPEGGWDDSELENAKSNGATVITLGGRILRAETAAISIAAVLQHKFGDLN
ncbi:16S rRNA (uracil(1498)-N(3))-methyltransferase [soil metagenome]